VSVFELHEGFSSIGAFESWALLYQSKLTCQPSTKQLLMMQSQFKGKTCA